MLRLTHTVAFAWVDHYILSLQITNFVQVVSVTERDFNLIGCIDSEVVKNHACIT